MATPLEVVVSADAGSQLWNLTVFDLHSGSSLLSYRGGNSAARSLTVLRGEFLLSAQLGKNYINVWEIQRKDQLQQKIVCPGMVTCLTASPDGVFLAAGVGEALHLWEVSSLSFIDKESPLDGSLNMDRIGDTSVFLDAAEC
uniref:WD repeat-containing protein 18 n=1 Tax=Oryzias sinensis TaxID=183150 RepID=A0A8C7YCA6_9TELE